MSLDELLADVMPAGLMPAGLMGVLTRTLALREIAEEVIDGAGVRDDILPHLQPGPFLELRPEMYRDHVQEIARRKGTKITLDVATEAEVLIALKETSLVTPLNAEGFLLYDRIFFRIFRQRFGGEPREQWAGQARELLDESRRKVRTGRPRMRVESVRKGRKP